MRLINRSRRKRVAGRKRHAETDKALSVGERYCGDTSDASIISIVFRPSDRRNTNVLKRVFSPLQPDNFFAPISRADRPTDRIDSHRSGLDTPRLSSPSLLVPRSYRTSTRTGTSVFRLRDPGEKALSPYFQHPLSDRLCYLN